MGISCSNVLKTTDRVLISFDAYDDDSGLNGGPDFIGEGDIGLNPNGEEHSGRVTLAHGNCDENGHLFYTISYITANPTANVNSLVNSLTFDSRMFFAVVTVQRALVCDADSSGGGYSDPYVDVRIHINDSEHECVKTTALVETNDPEWDEPISCSNVQFQATDKVWISF